MGNQRCQVFLSYNRADETAVEAIASKLRAAGVEPWLDKWNLIPGKPWQEEIETALTSCGSCAVFFGPEGTGPWQNEEMRTALDHRVREDHYRVIPVLLPGGVREERGSLPGFLTRVTWVKFRDLDDADAFRRLLAGIRDVKPEPLPGAVGPCPYRGLRYFDVGDAAAFHGRDALVDLVLDELRGRTGREANRFLGVVGCSGSGKSSFARAGLLASFERGAIEGSAQWPVAICRPGVNPLESLAVALAASLGFEKNPGQVLDLASRFAAGETALHVTTRLRLQNDPQASRLVVLVDQFEECFTLCRDKNLRDGLFCNLVYAATIPQGQTIVLLAMRADFYGECAAYPELAAALSDHQILIGPMRESELREAIEVPAREQGVEFDPGLVDLLLDEVKDQPAALPLLQYTLEELWKARAGSRLTHEAYRTLGTVSGVLGRRADEILGQFNPSEKEMCRHVLLRLVQHVEGEIYTRRRVPLADLASARFDAAALRPVVDKLAGESARLIVLEADSIDPNTQVVELAHEALIAGWPQLRAWLSEDRDFQRWRSRLRGALENWRDMKRDPSALLVGAVLDEALRYASLRADALAPEEQGFIHAGAEWRARQERAARVRRRNFRIAAVAGLVLFATGAVSTVFARREARLAESRRLAAAARNSLVRTDPSRALPLFLALHAFDLAQTREAEEALHQVVQFAGGAAIEGPKSAVLDVAYAPGGARLATAEDDGHIRVWDAASRKQLHELASAREPREPVYSIAFNPDGTRIAAGARDTASVWDIGAGTEIVALPRQPDAIMSVTFADAGRHFVTGGWDGAITVWDAATGATVRTFPKQGAVERVVVSPDGRRLATAHSEGTVKLWDLAPGTEVRAFTGLAKAPKSLAFSPDGRRLAASVWDGSVVVWDADSGSNLRSFVADPDGLNALAFSPDGSLLATAGLSGNGALWDARTGDELLTLVGAADALTAAAFQPSGERRVALASRDRSVRIYELDLERLKQRARDLIQRSATPLTAQNCAAYPTLKPCP
ncbi:MAG TPA: TIR domain-containing protein [Verrucomicrobiae bacterium]|nr:TIR domain-containing protein [Verrucomicrobiae bacterium]